MSENHGACEAMVNALHDEIDSLKRDLFIERFVQGALVVYLPFAAKDLPARARAKAEEEFDGRLLASKQRTVRTKGTHAPK